MSDCLCLLCMMLDSQVGMWVVKVGGPAYRIGLGGGAASSRVGDAGTAALDFDAVQVCAAAICVMDSIACPSCTRQSLTSMPCLVCAAASCPYDEKYRV